jgi:hypothetical protein
LSECDGEVVAYVASWPATIPADEVDGERWFTEPDTTLIQPGESLALHAPPASDSSFIAIIYTEGAYEVHTWGKDVNGSTTFTLSGDNCLVPRAES